MTRMCTGCGGPPAAWFYGWSTEGGAAADLRAACALLDALPRRCRLAQETVEENWRAPGVSRAAQGGDSIEAAPVSTAMIAIHFEGAATTRVHFCRWLRGPGTTDSRGIGGGVG